MDFKNRVQGSELLKEMHQKIDEIDRLVLELKVLGNGIPVVDKNTRSILSFINILKVGISDVAEIAAKKEVRND